MNKVLITTVPFGDKDRSPLDKLEENGISYLINPFGKKLTEDELITLVGQSFMTSFPTKSTMTTSKFIC